MVSPRVVSLLPVSPHRPKIPIFRASFRFASFRRGPSHRGPFRRTVRRFPILKRRFVVRRFAADPLAVPFEDSHFLSVVSPRNVWPSRPTTYLVQRNFARKIRAAPSHCASADIHASCDTKPPPWDDKIRAILHASSDTRELFFETAFLW